MFDGRVGLTHPPLHALPPAMKSTTSGCRRPTRRPDSGIQAGTPVAEHRRVGLTAEDKPLVRLMVSVIPGDTIVLRYVVATWTATHRRAGPAHACRRSTGAGRARPPSLPCSDFPFLIKAAPPASRGACARRGRPLPCQGGRDGSARSAHVELRPSTCGFMPSRVGQYWRRSSPRLGVGLP